MNVPEIREALLLAQELDTIVDHQDARYPNVGVVSQEAAAELRSLSARVQELEAEAIKESHRLAEANLRAAQMESQHKQAAEIATAVTKELATKSERIQELEAMLESIGAGGVF